MAFKHRRTAVRSRLRVCSCSFLSSPLPAARLHRVGWDPPSRGEQGKAPPAQRQRLPEGWLGVGAGPLWGSGSELAGGGGSPSSCLPAPFSPAPNQAALLFLSRWLSWWWWWGGQNKGRILLAPSLACGMQRRGNESPRPHLLWHTVSEHDKMAST